MPLLRLPVVYESSRKGGYVESEKCVIWGQREVPFMTYYALYDQEAPYKHCTDLYGIRRR